MTSLNNCFEKEPKVGVQRGSILLTVRILEQLRVKEDGVEMARVIPVGQDWRGSVCTWQRRETIL